MLSHSSADIVSGDSEPDGWSGLHDHKLTMIGQRCRTVFQVANVWDRVKGGSDVQTRVQCVRHKLD